MVASGWRIYNASPLFRSGPNELTLGVARRRAAVALRRDVLLVINGVYT